MAGVLPRQVAIRAWRFGMLLMVVKRLSIVAIQIMFLLWRGRPMAPVSLQQEAMELCRSGIRQQENFSTGFNYISPRCGPLHGRPMDSASSQPAMIRRCRSGMRRMAVNCLSIQVIEILSMEWRGPPMASISLRPVAIKPYRYGMLAMAVMFIPIRVIPPVCGRYPGPLMASFLLLAPGTKLRKSGRYCDTCIIK